MSGHAMANATAMTAARRFEAASAWGSIVVPNIRHERHAHALSTPEHVRSMGWLGGIFGYTHIDQPEQDDANCSFISLSRSVKKGFHAT
jgi:hypothetical protein